MYYLKHHILCVNFHKLTLPVLLFLFILVHFAGAQEDIVKIRDLWQQGMYSEALPKLLEHRKKPYGKNAAVDYMIATSACRIADHEKTGQKFFDWILGNYSLGKNRALVKSERDKCAPDVAPSNLAFATLRTGGSVGVSGKSYYWLGNEKTLAGERNALIASDPVEVIKEIPYEKISERLFEVSDKSAKKSAENYIQKMAGEKVKVKAFKAFIIASAGKHTEAEIETINKVLENYLYYFIYTYNMPEPEHFITVYLMPTTRQLSKIAEKIHGIKISRGSIGYSFRDDFSILGVIPTNRVGTLLHELFHLMTRNNFGDIPPWLDEGMASLYEVSGIEGKDIRGLPNWRGAVLKTFWSMRPSIDSMIKMNWHQFDGFESSLEQKAANHATARYFMLYLQTINKLHEVYEAFQSRDIIEIESYSKAMDPQWIIETVLEQSLSQTDQAFVKWFENL